MSKRVADQRCVTPLETSACSPVRGIAWEARLRHQNAREKTWRLPVSEPEEQSHIATTTVGAAPAATALIKKTPKHLPAPNGGFLSVRRRLDR
jgi:hypothetical protein